MNSILSSIGVFFSDRGILGFVAGVLFEYVFLKLRCRYLDKIHPEEGKHTVKFKRVYIVWALVFIVIGGLTYKTQVTYDAIVELTRDTQDCSRQFNAALRSRADINKEESAINARWQDANFDRTKALNDYSRAFGNTLDPRYIQAKAIVDETYYDKMTELFADRKSVQERRANLGYPEPTCGK